MKIFVANTTKQVHEFFYRVPENPKLMNSKIPIGGQVRLYKDDATSAEIDAIVSQLVVYGAVRSDEVDRTKPFIGLCYSLDKPVKDGSIMSAINHNDDVLFERGVELRKSAAIAVNELLDNGRGNVNGTTVTFKEEIKAGDNKDGLDETIEVVKEGRTPSPKRRRAA